MTSYPTDSRSRAEWDTFWLDKAIKLAVQSVACDGGPFGAVITIDDKPVASGHNRVTQDRDPTAHAEVVAIRASCAALLSFSLSGATLYSSCEPCPLCLSAALWARIDRVVYAADRNDALAAGFDDAAIYESIANPQSTALLSRVQLRLTSASAPFAAWVQYSDRLRY
ncbi:nucleoside deaminase [Leifsonia sp. NPDC102414]|uniref:nucleoside deaminase n=1 Tax=Leifsonia sp. NPDC102414 TaxID=3364124 RepID=UPI00380410A7